MVAVDVVVDPLLNCGDNFEYHNHGEVGGSLVDNFLTRRYCHHSNHDEMSL